MVGGARADAVSIVHASATRPLLTATTVASLALAIAACGTSQSPAKRLSSASSIRLSSASNCADWAAASSSAHAKYLSVSEPTLAASTASAVIQNLDTTCALEVQDEGQTNFRAEHTVVPLAPIPLDETAMNNAVSAVTHPASGQTAPLAGKGGVGILGATVADWNSAHELDPLDYPSGGSYDPTPALASNPYGDDRFLMSATNGRVTYLSVSLNPNSSSKQAIAQVLQVLPRDTTHGPLVPDGQCRLMSANSRTLQLELGWPNVLVLFWSGGGAPIPYDPTNVTVAVMRADQTIASNSFSC